MYEPRIYRDKLNNNRFTSFLVSYKETDLWVAVDKKSYKKEIKSFILEEIIKLRNDLENYISKNLDFKKSLSSLRIDNNSPEIVRQMFVVANESGIGPMSAVAGAFSEFIAKSVKSKFNIEEIVIENGGDIYLDIKEDFLTSIYAGDSPLSDKTGLLIKAEKTPLGICTSSGTVGHSLSFGKADAVVIVCKSALLADTYATKFCNMVKSEKDINTVLESVGKINEILSCVIIYKDKIAIKSEFELKIIK
jgi:ApbE superfamily uncharacterized protein (UPF0280 family)